MRMLSATRHRSHAAGRLTSANVTDVSRDSLPIALPGRPTVFIARHHRQRFTQKYVVTTIDRCAAHWYPNIVVSVSPLTLGSELNAIRSRQTERMRHVVARMTEPIVLRVLEVSLTVLGAGLLVVAANGKSRIRTILNSETKESF